MVVNKQGQDIQEGRTRGDGGLMDKTKRLDSAGGRCRGVIEIKYEEKF